MSLVNTISNAPAFLSRCWEYIELVEVLWCLCITSRRQVERHMQALRIARDVQLSGPPARRFPYVYWQRYRVKFMVYVEAPVTHYAGRRWGGPGNHFEREKFFTSLSELQTYLEDHYEAKIGRWDHAWQIIQQERWDYETRKWEPTECR